MTSSAVEKMRVSEVRLVELVVPEHANHYGTLYGVTALQLMGKAAFVCASRYARCAVVMAKADNIEFRKPVLLGEIIEIWAQVVFHGRSSMTVIVEIASEDASGKSESPRIVGRFMMVAVDATGAPIPIPGTSNQISREEMSL
jgi:acyl-CoA hydrolase